MKDRAVHELALFCGYGRYAADTKSLRKSHITHLDDATALDNWLLLARTFPTAWGRDCTHCMANYHKDFAILVACQGQTDASCPFGYVTKCRHLFVSTYDSSMLLGDQRRWWLDRVWQALRRGVRVGQRKCLAAFFADLCVLLKVRFGARLLVATHLRVVVIGRFDKLYLDVLGLVLGEFALLTEAPCRSSGVSNH